jgi:hypothetical protein
MLTRIWVPNIEEVWVLQPLLDLRQDLLTLACIHGQHTVVQVWVAISDVSCSDQHAHDKRKCAQLLHNNNGQLCT